MTVIQVRNGQNVRFSLGATCNHVAAVLFKLEHVAVHGPSCTSRPAEWVEPSHKRKLSPKRVKDMAIKRPHYRKHGKDCLH